MAVCPILAIKLYDGCRQLGPVYHRAIARPLAGWPPAVTRA